MYLYPTGVRLYLFHCTVLLPTASVQQPSWALVITPCLICPAYTSSEPERFCPPQDACVSTSRMCSVLRAIQTCAWPIEQAYLLFPGYVFSLCPNWPQFSDPVAVPVLQYNKRRQMIQFSVSLPEEIKITLYVLFLHTLCQLLNN